MTAAQHYTYECVHTSPEAFFWPGGVVWGSVQLTDPLESGALLSPSPSQLRSQSGSWCWAPSPPPSGAKCLSLIHI